jgi:hypothetical protein
MALPMAQPMFENLVTAGSGLSIQLPPFIIFNSISFSDFTNKVYSIIDSLILLFSLSARPSKYPIKVNKTIAKVSTQTRMFLTFLSFLIII